MRPVRHFFQTGVHRRVGGQAAKYGRDLGDSLRTILSARGENGDL